MVIKTKYIFSVLLLAAASFLFLASCGTDDDKIANPESLELYIEAKPAKGFLDDAVITINGATLTQEIGIDLYTGYLPSGTEFKAGDMMISTGGTIRNTGIQMDPTMPLKYMYDGSRTTFYITPLTTLVAESMTLLDKEPTLAEINNVKNSLLGLIDPEGILGGDVSKMDEDPEDIPAVEGLAHTIYFTFEGIIDTLKTLGYTIDANHISKIWGGLITAHENSQAADLDELLIDIITDNNFFPNQTIGNTDVLSAFIHTIFQTAANQQDNIIAYQQSENKTAFKNTSLNMVYTIQSLSQLSQTIYDKISEKPSPTITFFIEGIADLLSQNIPLVREKAVEDPDNLKDEVAAINELEELIAFKITNMCDDEDINPEDTFCFGIDETEINNIIAGLPNVPDLTGIIDWSPQDGDVFDTIYPDFYIRFSGPVDKENIDRYFYIAITNIKTEKSVRVFYVYKEDENEWVKYISIRIPGGTKILKEITEEEYIDMEWNKDDTKITLHVGSYTFEGETHELTDGATYSFTFKLLEGATYKNGDPIDPQTIGPSEFSIHVN